MSDNLNTLDIQKEAGKNVADKLNTLLATQHLHYQNLRGYHWNIKGEQFFTLHEKFEELYNTAAENIDEVAERILTLGFTPLHTLEDFLKESRVQSHGNVYDAKGTVQGIVAAMSTMITIEKEVAELADGANDSGTADLMDDLVGFQEKTIWMLRSFLGEHDAKL